MLRGLCSYRLLPCTSSRANLGQNESQALSGLASDESPALTGFGAVCVERLHAPSSIRRMVTARMTTLAQFGAPHGEVLLQRVVQCFDVQDVGSFGVSSLKYRTRTCDPLNPVQVRYQLRQLQINLLLPASTSAGPSDARFGEQSSCLGSAPSCCDGCCTSRERSDCVRGSSLGRDEGSPHTASYRLQCVEGKSGWQGSNLRPRPSEGRALPTALHPDKSLCTLPTRK